MTNQAEKPCLPDCFCECGMGEFCKHKPDVHAPGCDNAPAPKPTEPPRRGSVVCLCAHFVEQHAKGACSECGGCVAFRAKDDKCPRCGRWGWGKCCEPTPPSPVEPYPCEGCGKPRPVGSFPLGFCAECMTKGDTAQAYIAKLRPSPPAPVEPKCVCGDEYMLGCCEIHDGPVSQPINHEEATRFAEAFRKHSYSDRGNLSRAYLALKKDQQDWRKGVELIASSLDKQTLSCSHLAMAAIRLSWKLICS